MTIFALLRYRGPVICRYVFGLAILLAPLVQPAHAQSAPQIELLNLGGDLGGHTPRGFRGQGSGVFVGDNLNARFPNGDGLQAFFSFDLSAVRGEFQSAALTARFLKVNGTPFDDLGEIRLERVEFTRFSSAIWDIAAQANVGCILSISDRQNRAECDLTQALQAALADGAEFLQFRLRFVRISDNDRRQDLAIFYRRDVNQNEGGVFTLTLH